MQSFEHERQKPKDYSVAIPQRAKKGRMWNKNIKEEKEKGEKREKRRKIFSMRDQQVVKSAMQGYGLITMTNS